MPEKKATASFIEPMLLQRTAKIPEGPVDGEVINHAAMGVWYNPLEELPRSSSRVVVDGCQRVPELLGLALESGPESRFT